MPLYRHSLYNGLIYLGEAQNKKAGPRRVRPGYKAAILKKSEWAIAHSVFIFSYSANSALFRITATSCRTIDFCPSI